MHEKTNTAFQILASTVTPVVHALTKPASGHASYNCGSTSHLVANCSTKPKKTMLVVDATDDSPKLKADYASDHDHLAGLDTRTLTI